MMIGLKNNLINTVNFSNAGSTNIELSGRVQAKNTSRSNALFT